MADPREDSIGAERHTEEAGPGWDTKVHCSCGALFASRAELWRHQATALRALLDEEADKVVTPSENARLAGEAIARQMALLDRLATKEVSDG